MAKVALKKTSAPAAPAAAAEPVAETVETVVPAEAPAETLPQADELTTHDYLLDQARAKDKNFADQTPKEKDGIYLLRLITVLADVADADFESLPQDAKDWYNAAVAEVQGEKPISAPSGFTSKFGSTPAKAAPAAKAAKEKAAPKVKAPPAPKAPSKTFDLRKIVLRNPTATLDEIKAELAKLKLDINPSTITTIRSDVLATMEAAKAVGRWKDAI